MKTPKEIKNTLRHCSDISPCYKCVYNERPRVHFNHCVKCLEQDALAYIEQLEANNKELQERIDLMMIQMRGVCGCCKHKHMATLEDEWTCHMCIEKLERPCWEYEGLPEIGGKKNDA